MPAALEHAPHDPVAGGKADHRYRFAVLADKPYGLGVLEDEADLRPVSFGLDKQQGPALDLGPADDRGMGFSSRVADQNFPADIEVGEVRGLAVRHEDVGMDGTRVDAERPWGNVRVLERLGMDKEHG